MYKLNEKGRKMFIEASDEKGYDTFLKQMFEFQSLGEECPFSFKTSEILNSPFFSFEEADEKIKEAFNEQFDVERTKRLFCYSKGLDIFINKELLKEGGK